MEWISKSPEETQQLGHDLLERFPEARLICLSGPLGSGKTCFTKGIGKKLGLADRVIKSPTFTTLLEHDGTRKLYHCDFYRSERPQDFSADWWEELLSDPDAIVVAEWSERIEAHLPKNRLEITFIPLSEKERKLIVTLT